MLIKKEKAEFNPPSHSNPHIIEITTVVTIPRLNKNPTTSETFTFI